MVFNELIRVLACAGSSIKIFLDLFFFSRQIIKKPPQVDFNNQNLIFETATLPLTRSLTVNLIGAFKIFEYIYEQVMLLILLLFPCVGIRI